MINENSTVKELLEAALEALKTKEKFVFVYNKKLLDSYDLAHYINQFLNEKNIKKYDLDAINCIFKYTDIDDFDRCCLLDDDGIENHSKYCDVQECLKKTIIIDWK